MAIYINTKTKITLETDSVIEGGDWIKVEEEQKPKEPKGRLGTKGTKRDK